MKLKHSIDIKTALGKVFFLVCAAMTAFYLTAGYGAYLDSDMSSELVLAEHLASQGMLVSPDWYYSTEIRLLNTQLVFTPLMMLFSGNWQLVRTLGCIILQLILAASCMFAAREAGAKPCYSYVFAGLTISAVSPMYTQNVIVGAYYIPHAVLAFLLIGTYERWLRKRKDVLIILMLALAFVMGLSSVRYLVSAILPLACAVIWQFVFTDQEELSRTESQWKALIAGICIAAMGAAGYLIGKKVLPLQFNLGSDYYGSMGYASFSQHDLPRHIQTVAYGLLNAIGFQESVPLFGVQGILNALVLLELCAGGMLIRRALKRESEDYVNTSIFAFLFAFALSAGVFVLLRSVYFDRYWLPVIMLGAPVMALCFSKERNPVFRRLSLLLFAGVTLLTSASCMYYSMRSPQVESEMRAEVVETAREYGLTRGYATFWNANIVTELSDGEMDVVSVNLRRDGNGDCTLEEYRWLEAVDDFEMDHPDAPVFLLIGSWEKEGTDRLLSRLEAQHIEIDGWIDFYIVPSQERLFNELKAAEP
ncbi:MAG: hypothetical protein IJB85_03135 [Clostridia bacterium]|nr:hypothetical protein [Clostridia bacterium]